LGSIGLKIIIAKSILSEYNFIYFCKIIKIHCGWNQPSRRAAVVKR
jgi:hypothetical protein